MPSAERLAPGLWAIRVPALVSMLRGDLADTRAYLVACDGGFVVVDNGWDYPPAWSSLTSGITAAGFELSDCRGVLLTHSHPDHHGMSGRLREVTGCWVGMHPVEAELVARERTEGIPGLSGVPDWFFHAGAPETERAGIPELELDGFPPPPAVADRLVEDGRVPDVPGRELQALWTPGHAAGHLVFFLPDARVVLSGDHVLPGVSPYISLFDGDGDPLGDFLASLRRVAELEVDRVLPGHGAPFAGLRARVDELLEHHAGHLRAIEARLAQGSATLWELAQVMPWSSAWHELPWMLQHAALGEARAHVRHLERTGRVIPAAVGVPARYALVGSAQP